MFVHTRQIEILEVRAIGRQFVSGQPVPQKATQLAQDTIQTMFREGTRCGLTEADVIKAILQPVFDKKRGCDCPTCKVRRVEDDQARIDLWESSLSPQVAS